MDESTTRLLANLDAIDKIVRELPTVGKRSELKVKTDELLRLTEMARRELHLLHVATENRKRTIAPGNHSNARTGKRN
ncbi:hypothetical protein SAMN05216428_102333 [Nitrosospira sp. Nsp11]|uniref:hypothetical protein n=1 Tax=Nitrosospira sp. Nsp11 TaxID=1855338 RepID=UPI0009129B81|nr:hypothetical protein [Nitrosospira sp. Nsp11]SHL41596.1 hypothetical protein SAMN05216428_102333 [Nitrosospira sp. Nsp11]